MPKIATISRAQLNMALRLDAEHYSPRFIPVLQQLKKHQTIKLRDTLVEPIRTGHTPSMKNSTYYHPGIIKFIKTDNLREDEIDISEVQMLSELGNKQIAASELRPGDVIVTIIGATEDIIGRAACVQPELGRANINQNIALIRSRVSSGFLTVFLNSKYGREQLIWLSRQTGQVNLNCREVEELIIPIFSNTFVRFINELHRKRHDLLRSAVDMYYKAEQLLLTEVGLQNWVAERTLGFVCSYSRVLVDHRLDAEHFQPKYAALRNHIRNYRNGFTQVERIALISNERVDPRTFPNKQFRYVELANINSIIGTIRDASNITGAEAPSRARMLLRKGDVVVSSVEGSLNRVALVDEEYDKTIGSTGFFVLRPLTVESEYLLALAKSFILREQMHCEATGTILTSVPSGLLSNIIVPDIPYNIRKLIACHVSKSHALWKQSRTLFERIKKAVEIAVEKGEQKAMEYLKNIFG